MWSPKIDLKQSCMRWKLSHFTYRRSAFLGIPFGTVFKARPWQSTCDPEQLHLCGHPLTEAAHTRSAETRANPRQSAACLPGPLGGMVSSSNYFQSESDWKDVAVSSAKRDGSRDPDTGQRMPLKLVGGERSKKSWAKLVFKCSASRKRPLSLHWTVGNRMLVWVWQQSFLLKHLPLRVTRLDA